LKTNIAKIKGQFSRLSANSSINRKFGTLDGVFLPTLLTIMGAVMYLRTGWVVGNAGLGGRATRYSASQPDYP